MRKPVANLAVVALLLLPSQAQPQATSSLASWSLDLTTYGWLSATTGTTGAGPLRVKVDNSFIETIRQSDSVLSFMARGELRRGRLGLFLDGEYTDLGYDDVRLGPASVDATNIL